MFLAKGLGILLSAGSDVPHTRDRSWMWPGWGGSQRTRVGLAAGAPPTADLLCWARHPYPVCRGLWGREATVGGREARAMGAVSFSGPSQSCPLLTWHHRLCPSCVCPAGRPQGRGAPRRWDVDGHLVLSHQPIKPSSAQPIQSPPICPLPAPAKESEGEGLAPACGWWDTQPVAGAREGAPVPPPSTTWPQPPGPHSALCSGGAGPLSGAPSLLAFAGLARLGVLVRFCVSCSPAPPWCRGEQHTLGDLGQGLLSPRPQRKGSEALHRGGREHVPGPLVYLWVGQQEAVPQ